MPTDADIFAARPVFALASFNVAGLRGKKHLNRCAIKKSAQGCVCLAVKKFVWVCG
jgi:hypothetical protein